MTLDRTPRPYPAWWRRAAAERRALLDAAVARLRVEARTFASLEGVLVYGSYARGTTGPESDLDLIAVMRTEAPFAERGLALRTRLGHRLEVPFDLVVYTPEEYAGLAASSSFMAQARAEGVWIDAAAPA